MLGTAAFLTIGELAPSMWDKIVDDMPRIDDAGGFGSPSKIPVVTTSATGTSVALVDTDDNKAGANDDATTAVATTTGTTFFRRRKAFRNTFKKAGRFFKNIGKKIGKVIKTGVHWATKFLKRMARSSRLVS